MPPDFDWCFNPRIHDAGEEIIDMDYWGLREGRK